MKLKIKVQNPTNVGLVVFKFVVFFRWCLLPQKESDSDGQVGIGSVEEGLVANTAIRQIVEVIKNEKDATSDQRKMFGSKPVG